MLLELGLHVQNHVALLVWIECVCGMKESLMQTDLVVGVKVGVCHTTGDMEMPLLRYAVMFDMHIKHTEDMFPTPPVIQRMFLEAEIVFC